MASIQKISPCLWFDRNGEEAANFYTSIFPNSRVTGKSFYGEGAPLPAGTVLTVSFELAGQTFLALNGGPIYQFTEAVSMMINCDTQEEIDHYWSKLTEGGKEIQCGWLKDKFGLPWQVAPSMIVDMTLPPKNVSQD